MYRLLQIQMKLYTLTYLRMPFMIALRALGYQTIAQLPVKTPDEYG